MDEELESKYDSFKSLRDQRLMEAEKTAAKISQKVKRRNRVHTKDFILMMGVAFFFDTLQDIFLPIPIVGWMLSSFISIFAWLTFYVWTSIKGWGMSDTVKQIVVQWALPIGELIWPINILPLWTLKTFIQLSMLKAEDEIYNASGGKADIEKLAFLYQKVVHGQAFQN